MVLLTFMSEYCEIYLVKMCSKHVTGQIIRKNKTEESKMK